MIRHQVVALGRRGSQLSLALSDPSICASSADPLPDRPGIDPVVVEAQADAVVDIWSRSPCDTSEGFVRRKFDMDLAARKAEIADLHRTRRRGGRRADRPASSSKMLIDAISEGASDIHFEPTKSTTASASRTDGILRGSRSRRWCSGKRSPPASGHLAPRHLRSASPRTGRMKLVLSKNNHRLPRLDAAHPLRREDRDADPRPPRPCSASMPSATSPTRRALYGSPAAYGMMLVTGPTGSGKTVSLYTGSTSSTSPASNISTAEDPAEINLPASNQVNVNKSPA